MTSTFDFGDFPVLTAKRIKLVEFDARHAADIFAFRGDAEVQLYNSEPHKTIDDTLRFIDEERERYRQKQEIIWAIMRPSSGRVVGSVSVFDWDRYHRRASMGYDMARDSWGMGFAQEAMREVIKFGFERMALNRLEIWTAAENVRSVRLAERLGFTREGTLRKRSLEDDGQFHDGAMFGLLRDDWAGATMPSPDVRRS